MKLVELNLATIPFGQPIPFALRGVGGSLLANKGFVIRSAEDLRILLARGQTLFVDTDESGDSYRAFLAQIQSLVPKSFRQRPSDSEPQLFVQPHGGRVRAHDVVELHCQKSIILGLGKTVLDKCATLALSLGVRTHQVGSARNVRSEAAISPMDR